MATLNQLDPCESRKMTPIEEEFERLEQAVRRCASAVDDLGGSISPILREGGSPACGMIVQASPNPSSPLAGRLRELAGSVERIFQQAVDLRDRNTL